MPKLQKIMVIQSQVELTLVVHNLWWGKEHRKSKALASCYNCHEGDFAINIKCNWHGK
jgi:hypothetical protein